MLKLSHLKIYFYLVFFFCSSLLFAEKYGGRVILSLAADPKSFNPIISKEATTSSVLAYSFEGLTKIDGVSTQVVAHLAKKWNVSSDGLIWEFLLRDDVKWADGVQFTSKDVVFTFNELIFNPNVDTSLRDILVIEGQPIKVESTGKYKVKITLSEPFAPFLMLMAGVDILPEHLLKKIVEENQFNSHWGVYNDPSKVIGTGPYRIVEYKSGQHIILRKNNLYWKKNVAEEQLPFIDEIIFLIVPNNDIAFLKFQQGDLDFYSMRGSDYPILKPLEEKKNFTVYNTGVQFGTNFLVFNQNDRLTPKGKPYLSQKKINWFTNLNFRKAIAHCIDRESIIDILLNGFGQAQYGPISPAAKMFYNSDVTVYSYDIRKAKALLKNAGFVYKDDRLWDKSGNKIQFDLLTNAGNTVRIKISELIRKDISQLGIDVNFVAMEFNSLVTKLNATYDWDAILLGLTGGIEPHFGRNVWHSSGRMHLWNPKQETPKTIWEQRIDEIFDEAVTQLNHQPRKILYDEFQKIVSDQVPIIYTVLSERLLAVRNKYFGLKPSSYGGLLHNLEEWYVKKENE